MKDFNFRYGEPFGFDKIETQQLNEKELQREIGQNIDIQIGLVCMQLLKFCTQQGIDEEELNSSIACVKECIDSYHVDDMTLSSLINYANASGGILKIHVELRNGTRAELL